MIIMGLFPLHAGNPVVVGDGEPTLGGLAEIGATSSTLLACGIREVRGWMAE